MPAWDPETENRLIEKRMKTLAGGGAERVQSQHEKGKMTARERIDCLLDTGSFCEIQSMAESRNPDIGKKHLSGDGVVTGWGTIDGRTVCVAAQDFTVIGGTLGEMHAKKICHIMDMALRMRVPYISINDSGGARIEEGISSLDGYSGIFLRNTKMSGIVPQISVILGPCAGGACYSPAITDFVFMNRKTASMFITGPAVVEAVTGETVSTQELGGARVHGENSGVAHFIYDDDRECLLGVRNLLAYLPGNRDERPKGCPSAEPAGGPDIGSVVPDNQRQPYEIRDVIRGIADADSFLEIQSGFARNVVIGFARIEGETVGFVANNPRWMSGTLDIDSSEKAARFVRFCDCFGIPLVTLVDVPGFMPGRAQEHGGIIRRGAKLLYAFAEATVPRITVILRKAFGGAYIAMNSKGMGADLVYAWPTAQTAVMGAEGAVTILYGKELKEAADPAEERRRLVEAYERDYMNPYIAAERGYVDEVILPGETRARVAAGLRALRQKDRKTAGYREHGNIPL